MKVPNTPKPIPILVLSSKPGSEDRIAALKAGAHGYVEKPYDLEECLAHAQSLMELYAQLHTSESRCYTLAFGMDLIIDPVKHQATLKGEPLNLTRKEFDLLFHLASHAGQVLSREQLYNAVWKETTAYNVDEQVKLYLARKLKLPCVDWPFCFGLLKTDAMSDEKFSPFFKKLSVCGPEMCFGYVRRLKRSVSSNLQKGGVWHESTL